MPATDSAAATGILDLPPEPSLPTRPLERMLRLFSDVREGEGPRLLALTLNVFLILVAYYVMKPVREVLILAQPGGAELKSYAYAAQAVLLIVLVPLYGAVAARLPRRRLINVVTALFIACLPVFYMLAERGVVVGLVFFLWIGVFSLMVIAQFWAYANDLYTPAAGKRLFAVIAFGASAGAVAGAWLSGRLIQIIGAHALLLAAAACWCSAWRCSISSTDATVSGARPVARPMTSRRRSSAAAVHSRWWRATATCCTWRW